MSKPWLLRCASLPDMSRSFKAISSIISSKLILGSQLSSFFAFDVSPRRISTSVGRTPFIIHR
jgi:hypothetical protein